MKRSIWKIALAVLVFGLLAVALLKSGRLVEAGQSLSANSQAAPTAAPGLSGAPGLSSQGTPAKTLPNQGEPVDTPERLASLAGASSYFHIPGSVFTSVDADTTLGYSSIGCVYAKTGGYDLLNAPLIIPDGSTLSGVRLYYNDTNPGMDIRAWITRYNLDGTAYDDLTVVDSSGSAGRGSVWADVDPSKNVIDAYTWSYVINIRTNSPGNSLQVCGIRVTYTPPPGCCTFLPAIRRDALP